MLANGQGVLVGFSNWTFMPMKIAGANGKSDGLLMRR